MANLVMFCILAVIILGSAVMCVLTKSIMRAATFLLFVLFGVAGIYFLLDYTNQLNGRNSDWRICSSIHFARYANPEV